MYASTQNIFFWELSLLKTLLLDCEQELQQHFLVYNSFFVKSVYQF